MNAKGKTVVKCFNQSNQFWRNDATHNMTFVKTSLNYCYEKFRAQGHLFLNEVYQELGLILTRQGQVAGWILDEKYMKDTMWTVSTYDDCDVYITFEPLENILDALSDD